jgi:hypothetical protein
MRSFFRFWWICAKTAFWGNTAFANDWQWVFGIPALSGLAGFLAANKGAADLSTGYPILDGFLTALGAFIVTWTIAFAVRMLNAPVVLFHEQKDRADALEGVPVAKPRSSDKNLAILQERYLSNKPPMERELLDYEVDGLQAIKDVTLIFDGINASATRITKITNRHMRKFKPVANAEQKRRAVSKFADDLNSYSAEIDDYTEIFRALTPAMSEYTSKYIERGPQVTKESYIALGKATKNNVQTATTLFTTVGANHQITASFRGVSSDLNGAADRLDAANSRLLDEISRYRDACESLYSIVTKRSAPHGESQDEQAAV